MVLFIPFDLYKSSSDFLHFYFFMQFLLTMERWMILAQQEWFYVGFLLMNHMCNIGFPFWWRKRKVLDEESFMYLNVAI